MNKLPPEIVEKLINSPETGMGYQVGDATLKDGRVFKRVVIYNGSEIAYTRQGYGPVCPFNGEDVVKFVLTHEKN